MASLIRRDVGERTDDPVGKTSDDGSSGGRLRKALLGLGVLGVATAVLGRRGRLPNSVEDLRGAVPSSPSTGPLSGGRGSAEVDESDVVGGSVDVDESVVGAADEGSNGAGEPDVDESDVDESDVVSGSMDVDGSMGTDESVGADESVDADGSDVDESDVVSGSMDVDDAETADDTVDADDEPGDDEPSDD